MNTRSTPIAMIGFGAIGRYVAAALEDDPDYHLSDLIVRPPRIADISAKAGNEVHVTDSIDKLTGTPAMIVEVAGHGALGDHAAAALRAGHTVLVVSVGALADPDLYRTVRDAAAAGGGTAIIAPGAVGGIDALSAARQGGLDRVTYTSRKPPLAWKGTPGEDLCDLDTLSEAVTLFEGPADEAARTYPKNANVAATIALAGTGFSETAVRVIADPAAPGNVHELEASGTFGRMSLRIEGKPLESNPKTSSLTAFSVLRAIRNSAAAIRI